MLFGTGGGGAGRRGGFSGFGDFAGAGPRGAGADVEAELPLTLQEATEGGTREISFADPATGERKTLSVRIPPGVRAGQKIRLAGQGHPGRGGAAGDLFLKIEILPDPRFKVQGADLHTTVPVTPWEAALGGEAEVETLEGPVRVKVPAGSSSGRKIRLRGKGLAQGRNGGGGTAEKGDLIAELKIVVPESLTPRERELFEQLAESSRFRARD
jgi:curved DNA-binding protein